MTQQDTILMLHPLNPKLLDPSCLLPLATTPTYAKHPVKASPRAHRVPHTPTPSTPPSSPCVDDAGADGPPRKRLKTTAEQINMLEEWFLREPLPTRKVREEMVQKLDGVVSLRQLEVWFQNRRAKQKKADARSHNASFLCFFLSSLSPLYLHLPLFSSSSLFSFYYFSDNT